jgi:hypothetical protein
MELQGKIKLIGETQTFGSNGFQKRELVLTTDEQYPQILLIEFVQDKCELLSTYKTGDEVSVFINIRGREWVSPEGVTKYFNTIQGWRIQTTTSEEIKQIEPFQDNTGQDENDEFPFF